MNRELSRAAYQAQDASTSGRGPRAAVASRAPEGAASVMNALLRGYREEALIYLRVLELTWRQRDILRGGMDLSLFRDLLEEKEDLLRMVAQINSEMRSARSLVLSYPPSQRPNCRELEQLLDRLSSTVEEVRIAESNNARLLEAARAN